jgi:hypothetical protein
MNPSEFRVEREKRLKEFDNTYTGLKRDYSSALTSAMKETDRAKQCVLIKTALDKNKELTTAVQSFLTLSDDKSCKLTPEMVRNLRADIEKYKKQYAEIQQGRDRVYALQQSYEQLQQQSDVLHGSQFLYVILIAIAIIILVVLVGASRIRDVLNAEPIAPVIPRSFT